MFLFFLARDRSQEALLCLEKVAEECFPGHHGMVDILPPHIVKDCADAGTSAEALTDRTARHTMENLGGGANR